VDKGGQSPISNPDWVWDEIVLACDLVVNDDGWRELRTGDPRVAELSDLLRQLPIHPVESRESNFRSPDAVSRKTTDLATAHPEYAGKRTRGGRTDLKVINEFMADTAGMKAVASAIRFRALAGDFDHLTPRSPGDLDEDLGVEEGGLLLRSHYARERNAALRARKIKEVLDQGLGLECSVCDFDFAKTYGPRGKGYIECHHVVPLHVTGARRTKLADLILLCANCHRMVHRAVPWLTPEEVRACLGGRSAQS